MLTLSRFASTACMMLLLSGFSAFAVVYDDAEPEVTARVARISFLRGDVKVRRSDSDEWEAATLNLPVVEGDELTTGDDGRVELQFGARTHLRADRNSYLQIKQLSDEGVAVSVSAGSATARLRKFEGDKEFFEMDAPGTTVAVQKEGTYRIDAGEPGGPEVRVTVTNGGEARVYSANSGFQLRSGRSAKVFIDGDFAGEWETADAGRFEDEFASWAAERDEIIGKRVDAANYGSYYDQDIYGADELNDNGSWEYTRDYGYIWRPHASAISVYRDWSPYRYGSWRWVSPFGWTWVNDEPWGWATYHHGRWIWYRGRWVWTPYGYYRSNRSWWYPALVVIRVINRNICWYPLGYHNRYYSYNRGYHDWVGNRRHRPRNDDRAPGNGGGSGTPVGQPRPPREREPIEIVPGDGTIARTPIDAKPIDTVIPPSGVVSVSAENFGITRKIGATAPPEIAREALRKMKAGETSPPELPDVRTLRGRPDRDITAQPPQIVAKAPGPTRTGAGERRRDMPLDRELMKSRIFGNRPPISDTPDVQARPGGQDIQPRTGAVGRPAPPKRGITATPIERDPAEVPTVRSAPPGGGQPRYIPPRRDPPTPKEDSPSAQPAPRQVTPKPREVTPRFDPPPRRDPPAPKQDNPAPRSEPPPRRDPPAPKQEQPRSNPPPRRESAPPKSDAPRSEPPPRRSQPGVRKQDPD